MPDYNTIELHPNSFLPSKLTEKTFDVITIGSGWSASTVASRMTKAGLTTLMVEAELFGGDCPFWACVPSKALLRPGEVLEDVKAVQGAAEKLQSPTNGPDPHGVFARRDNFTSKWDDEVVIIKIYQSIGASLVRGRGALIGEKKVLVKNDNGEEVVVEARRAVLICTGSVSTIPPIPGLADANPWTARHATSTSKIPKHLVILGAGAVGCEMADHFATLGGKVTLISSSPEILPRVDPDAGAVVRKRFQEKGIDVLTSALATKVLRTADGQVLVQVKDHGTVEGTEILVAAGRKAVLKDLGLEKLGVDTSGRFLATNDALCVMPTSRDWLYAGGDVNGRSPLSHGAKYHGRVIASAILARMKDAEHQITPWSRAAATADHFAVPSVVFTRPNVASVGLTRNTASKKGVKIKEFTAATKTLGAQLRSETYGDGWAQWIVDEASGKLLGATFVGDDAADLLHASTVAVVGGLTLDQLSHAVPSFPTMSEVYLNLLEAAGY